jgi:hypothetical protein
MKYTESRATDRFAARGDRFGHGDERRFTDVAKVAEETASNRTKPPVRIG